MTDTSKASKVKEAYKARATVEQEGVWLDILGGEIKIRAATPRNKEFARLTKGLQDGQRISEDKLFDKLASIFGSSIVCDWDGFDQDYSSDAFKETCQELREFGFLEDIIALAKNTEMFNSVALAAIEKN